MDKELFSRMQKGRPMARRGLINRHPVSQSPDSKEPINRNRMGSIRINRGPGSKDPVNNRIEMRKGRETGTGLSTAIMTGTGRAMQTTGPVRQTGPSRIKRTAPTLIGQRMLNRNKQEASGRIQIPLLPKLHRLISRNSRRKRLQNHPCSNAL